MRDEEPDTEQPDENREPTLNEMQQDSLKHHYGKPAVDEDDLDA